MSELEWHTITKAEEDGKAYEYILDVSPGEVPDQAAEYKGDTIIRTSRPGWTWWARFIPKNRDKKDKSSYGWDAGNAATKEQAIEDGLKALDYLRVRDKLRNPGQ